MQAFLHRKYKVFHYHNFLLVFQTQKLGEKNLIKCVKYKEPGSERDRFLGWDDSRSPDASLGWAWQRTPRFALGRACRLGSNLDFQPHSPQGDGKIQHHLEGMLLLGRAYLGQESSTPIAQLKVHPLNTHAHSCQWLFVSFFPENLKQVEFLRGGGFPQGSGKHVC